MTRLLLVAVLALQIPVHAEQRVIVFTGRPFFKISEGGNNRTPEQLDLARAVSLECVISRIGEEYYWASREDTPLSRVESGAFITFVASNGAGYVRVIDRDWNGAASMMSETEALLELDPRWAPVRDHPRFEALLVKYGQAG